MINELFEYTIDNVFHPLNSNLRLSEHKENLFELIYCEMGSKFNNGEYLNAR